MGYGIKIFPLGFGSFQNWNDHSISGAVSAFQRQVAR
jgi:hypothetical protein